MAAQRMQAIEHVANIFLGRDMYMEKYDVRRQVPLGKVEESMMQKSGKLGGESLLKYSEGGWRIVGFCSELASLHLSIHNHMRYSM